MRRNSSELYLVADRGVLKIYRLDNEGGPVLRPVEEMTIAHAHRHFAREYADQAGAFPNGGTAGRGNSIAERQDVAAENEMRSFRRIAAKIEQVLYANPGRTWSFAAPEEINGAILDGLPPVLRERLQQNLPKDLVNIPAQSLLAHFQS